MENSTEGEEGTGVTVENCHRRERRWYTADTESPPAGSETLPVSVSGGASASWISHFPEMRKTMESITPIADTEPLPDGRETGSAMWKTWPGA